MDRRPALADQSGDPTEVSSTDDAHALSDGTRHRLPPACFERLIWEIGLPRATIRVELLHPRDPPGISADALGYASLLALCLTLVKLAVPLVVVRAFR